MDLNPASRRPGYDSQAAEVSRVTPVPCVPEDALSCGSLALFVERSTEDQTPNPPSVAEPL